MAVPTSSIPPIVQLQFNALERARDAHLSELQVRKFWPELIAWVEAQCFYGPEAHHG